MPTPPMLSFEELLQPIPGDNPAGETVPFTVRKELEEFRKEVNPKDFAEDDPMRPEEAKYADWAGIIRLGQKTLTETSKVLLAAARPTEAETKEHRGLGQRLLPQADDPGPI